MNEIQILGTGKKFAHATVGSLRSFEGKQFRTDIGAKALS